MASVGARQRVQNKTKKVEEHRKAIVQMMDYCRVRGAERCKVLEMHGVF
jgi:hypothetical protein